LPYNKKEPGGRFIIPTMGMWGYRNHPVRLYDQMQLLLNSMSDTDDTLYTGSLQGCV